MVVVVLVEFSGDDEEEEGDARDEMAVGILLCLGAIAAAELVDDFVDGGGGKVL